jgi:hypothetical protein
MSLKGRHRVQGEAELVAVEDDAVLPEFRAVGSASEVEAGRTLEPKPHLAPDDPHQPDQLVSIGGLPPDDRHEVDHFPDAGRGHEPRYQNSGVRDVELPDDNGIQRLGSDLKSAAPLCVEERCEDAGRVETRAAIPVDTAARAHEGRCLQIADHAVMSDQRVAHLAHPGAIQIRPPVVL